MSCRFLQDLREQNKREMEININLVKQCECVWLVVNGGMYFWQVNPSKSKNLNLGQKSNIF